MHPSPAVFGAVNTSEERGKQGQAAYPVTDHSQQGLPVVGFSLSFLRGVDTGSQGSAVNKIQTLCRPTVHRPLFYIIYRIEFPGRVHCTRVMRIKRRPKWTATISPGISADSMSTRPKSFEKRDLQGRYLPHGFLR